MRRWHAGTVTVFRQRCSRLDDQSMPLKLMPACATAGSEIKKADTAAAIARRMNLRILLPPFHLSEHRGFGGTA